MYADLNFEICRFVREWPESHLPGGVPYFDEPLLGVADGDDPLFEQYRQIIGPFHWTPRQLFSTALPHCHAESLSVVCWVLPITANVRASNRPETEFPSRQWALTRTYGEALNTALRIHVVSWLQDQGIPSVAPQLAEGWQQLDDPQVGITSTWSERHAAYAAGLGTFSLNDGLITERGIAHRLGSVVAAAAFPVSKRSAELRGNCLYSSKGTCGACVRRCPVGALTLKGHDKYSCRVHVYDTVLHQVGELYGVAQTGCGLCQTAVPCEATNPCNRTGKN